MGTMEPVNSKDSSENEFEWFMDRDGGTDQRQFIYSEKLWTNDRTEIEIERVNIRPRKFDFLGLLNLGQSNTIKSKTKERFVLTV